MTPNEKKLVETKICCSCEKEKSITHFYKNKINSITNRCKLCILQGNICVNQTRSKLKNKKEDGPQLFNVSKNDWVKTFLFLQEIGYDLKKDIHLQFCEKHNFEPNKRAFENSIIYSPKDLGMI